MVLKILITMQLIIIIIIIMIIAGRVGPDYTMITLCEVYLEYNKIVSFM